MEWALDHRKVVVFAMIAVIVVSALAAPLVGSEFFPETDEGKINVEVSLPLGKVDVTDEVMKHIEEKVMEIQKLSGFSSFGYHIEDLPWYRYYGDRKYGYTSSAT